MKYIERRKQSKDQIEEQQLQYDLEDNKAQLEADLTATSRARTATRRELEDAKSKAVLDSSTIISLLNDIEGLEKGKKTLETLIEELF